MWNATRHNFNVILLNCGMNIQIRKIQEKSLILTQILPVAIRNLMDDTSPTYL